MHLDLLEITAALTAAMQEDDERPFLCLISLVALGFAQQVAVMDLDDEVAAEVLRRLGVGEGE
jgi:hypothetical protein